ncbi:MAG: hypothetical protein A2136_03515 [Chloroflexi bacterium RBG_16_54_11]|nr:MAG: hypothetical protein A2136_03515 [Chloroflexi bacterium RBG_16_54_11]
MATNKQKTAAKKNIKKAQQKWSAMSSRKHSLAQPEGRARAKVGTKGEGNYYRIVVRPKGDFTTFRYQDVGEKGHIQRLAGKRSSGSWGTQAWLISKGDAHIADGKLIPDTTDAKSLIQKLGTQPKRVKGDVFEAKDRPNIAEKKKPTEAQKKAWMANIKKAQLANARRYRNKKK